MQLHRLNVGPGNRCATRKKIDASTRFREVTSDDPSSSIKPVQELKNTFINIKKALPSYRDISY